MIIPKEQIKAENLIVDEYGLVYSSDGKTLMGSTEELTAGKYVIKDGTKVIGKNALYLYDEFQIENEDDEIELEIADSVEVIEDRSFDNLTLIKVKLPKNLKEIGLGAFVPPINNTPHYIQPVEIYDKLVIYADVYNLELLDQIKVRDLTLDVKAYGWDGCIIDLNGRKDLESITLNVDGCTIEAGAFCGCDNLKHVNLHYNIRVEDDAFDGENAYLNKFVDLALPSGSLWARIDVDGKPRFEVLPNKNFAINMGGTPTRDQMKELYSSCSWKETDNGWVGRSQYNGQEILLSKEGFKKIWTAYSIQYRYEYASITGPDAALQTKTLTDLGAKGFDIVSANPTAIILRREIKL